MSEKNQTITGGLGIREGYFEVAQERVVKKLKDLDTISDALEAVAEEIRDEEFGESNLRVSDYEKKLILSGFIMGCVRSEAQMSQKLDELKMMFHLMAMSKQVGTNKDGSPILGGMIDAKDMPKELRDLLEKLSGEDDEDD
jgi:hypothetical protein